MLENTSSRAFGIVPRKNTLEYRPNYNWMCCCAPVFVCCVCVGGCGCGCERVFRNHSFICKVQIAKRCRLWARVIKSFPALQKEHGGFWGVDKGQTIKTKMFANGSLVQCQKCYRIL